MAEADEVQTPNTDNSGAQEQGNIEPGQAPDQQGTPEGQGTEAGTLAAGGGGADDGNVAPPSWPDDWRAKMAKGDDKVLKRLERFKSPEDMWQSYRGMEQKLSSGEMRPVLGENATDEEIAAYRKANDIPDDPAGYLEKLPDGLVVGEEDKPFVSSFLEAVHGNNASRDVVGKAIDWYYKTQEDQLAAQAQADKQFRQESEDALRAEWGGEFRSNINSVMAFLDTAPAEGDASLKELLLGARLSDGSLLGDNPLAMRWLAQMANDANPAGFVAPSGGAGQLDSIETEIAEIEAKMRTDRAAYNKDEKMQARLRQLYEAQEKLSKR